VTRFTATATRPPRWALSTETRRADAIALPLTWHEDPDTFGVAVIATLLRYGHEGSLAVMRADGVRCLTMPERPDVTLQDLRDVLRTARPADQCSAAVGIDLAPGPDGRPGDVMIGFRWRDDGSALHAVAGALNVDVAAQLVGVLGYVLGQVIQDDGSTRVDDLRLLDPHAESMVLAAGGHPVGERPTESITRRFARIARRFPDRVALSDEDRTMTYRELDEISARVASGLLSRGVSSRQRIGLCTGRDVSAVVGALGILRAGGTYVPLDPNYPRQRLDFITEDADLSLVVRAEAAVSSERECSLTELAAAEPATLPDVAAGQDAYVIYTSGSTGRPKGVVVPHRNVVTLITACQEIFELDENDVWTLFHSTCFDFSVWEIWGPLLTGGHVTVPSFWTTRAPDEFYDFVRDHRVTVLSQTPSAFTTFRAEDERRADDLAVRLVVLGGEPLDVSPLESWLRLRPPESCRLVNMFGITESTVHVTHHLITPEEVRVHSQAVGRPLPGWSLSIRDARGRVQPFGVAGEIVVGGLALADRYLRREKLTSERFPVDDVTGARVYRSGDVGLLRPDGVLVHLGRLDDQVKVRGYRIELGEVRAALASLPSVSAAAVVYGDEPPIGARIDGFVVASEDQSAGELRRRLSEMLPGYMVPTTITIVDEIPLNQSGKVDKVALLRMRDAKLKSPLD
jgi:amino acid adenylation domain-containing protein